MKKIFATLAAAALLSGGAVVATTTAAQATPAQTQVAQQFAQKGVAKKTRNKTPRCVTKKEFRRIHKGMSPRKVKRITGTWGKKESVYVGGGYRSVTRDYKPCKPFNKYGYVSISYDNRNNNWKRIPMSVDYKSAFWLHN